MREIYKGATSQIEYFSLADSTTGLGKTGLAYTDMTGSYTRAGASRTAITMATQTVSGAYSSGGFVEVDATNCPGLYRFDVPNAAFASGVDKVIVSLKATAVKTEHKEFRLVTFDKQSTALQNLILSAGVIIPGTVDSGSFSPTATQFEADDITETTALHYNGRIVLFTSGALLGQASSISGYTKVGSNGRFTVVAMTEAPGNNDTFIIV